MKLAWKLLIAAGGLLVMVAMGLDTTVSTGYGRRVHNLGLQQQQLMLLILGCMFFLAGIVLFGILKIKQTPDEAQHERDQAKKQSVLAAETVQGAGKLVADAAQEAGKVATELGRETHELVSLFGGAVSEKLPRLRRAHVLRLGAVLIGLSALFPPYETTWWDSSGVMRQGGEWALIGTASGELLVGMLVVQVLLLAVLLFVLWKFAKE